MTILQMSLLTIMMIDDVDADNNREDVTTADDNREDVKTADDNLEDVTTAAEVKQRRKTRYKHCEFAYLVEKPSR